MRTKVAVAIALLIAAGGLTGCWTSSPVVYTPSAENYATVKLVVDSGTNTTIVDPLARTNPWNAGAPDSLTISSGKFLVRSVQFVQASDYTVDTDISAADEAQDEGDSWIPYQGPYVLPTAGSTVKNLGVQDVEVGTFNAISLVLHQGKTTDNLGLDSDMIGRSVLVTGYAWYGDRANPFVFDIDLRTEILVLGDFTVPSTGAAEYVVVFNVGKWFRYGDQWLDPNKVENLSLIYRNIQRLVSGGRDYNMDGAAG
jgi:hypothetical protein